MSRLRFGIVVTGILLVALALRIFALNSLSDSIYYDHLLFDERIYHNWAVQIMNGTWKTDAVYEFAPIPAYFTALVYTLFSPDIFILRVVNILFGISTCLLICLAGIEIGGRRIGLFSLVIAAGYTPLIFYSVVPLKTAMSLMLFSLFVWLFLKLLNYGTRWHEYLLAGLVVGIMLNVRPNYLVVIPPLFGFIIFTGYRDKLLLSKLVFNNALLCTGICLSVLPFIVRNYIVADEVALTMSQAGFNLYIGNNPGNDLPYYRPLPFASSAPFKQGIQFNIEASKRAGKKLSAQQASAFWMQEVFQIAQRHPTVFWKKIYQKTLAFFNRFEAGDHYHIGFLSRFVPFFSIPMLSFWIVLPLGMAGMIAGMRKDRKIAACASLFVCYGITLVAFYGNTRYRLPLLVILIPLAVYGCEICYKSIKSQRHGRAALILVVAFIFLVIEFLPLKGTDDMTAYYNTHALVLSAQGKNDESITFWHISSKMNKSYSVYANLALANNYFKKGDNRKAVYFLDKIPNNSFGSSNKFELLGDIALKMRQLDEAETSYRRSLDINSGNMIVWRKLIRLLKSQNRKSAGEESEKLKYISSFYR